MDKDAESFRKLDLMTIFRSEIGFFSEIIIVIEAFSVFFSQARKAKPSRSVCAYITQFVTHGRYNARPNITFLGTKYCRHLAGS